MMTPMIAFAYHCYVCRVPIGIVPCNNSHAVLCKNLRPKAGYPLVRTLVYVQHGPDITTGNGTCSLGIQFLPSALLMARQAHQVARAALRAAPGALPHRVVRVLVHRLAPVGRATE